MSIYPNRSKLIPAEQIERVCERIVNNVTINDNGCWIWNGPRMASGYGKMTIAGKVFYTHRVSSELFHDSFDPMLLVCHECPHAHNKACINPWHLKQGDQTYNMRNEQTRELLRQKALAAIERGNG